GLVVEQVEPLGQAALANNAAVAESFVLAGGLPQGLDLLNHEARVAGVTARVEYGGDRAGASAAGAFVGFDRGVVALP
ncbi:MAG TPA: hypothetical protein VNX21_01190, partial [Candidatus Thermoplasmatota archaeon]|nr:hypothetical protein [Candidatus Thermoplasmatota archaeon]